MEKYNVMKITVNLRMKPVSNDQLPARSTLIRQGLND